MARFKFENSEISSSNEILIFDTKKGQAHDYERIATVYDPLLAIKIVEMLNNNPRHYMSMKDG